MRLGFLIPVRSGAGVKQRLHNAGQCIMRRPGIHYLTDPI